MLTDFILKHLARAKYKILDDGTFFGEIPRFKGVWAHSKTLESCRVELQEVLEDWLVLKLQDGDSIPGFPKQKKRKSRKRHSAYA